LLVRAALDDAPVFEREDDVSLADRFQVVGDDDDGLLASGARALEHELSDDASSPSGSSG